MKKKIVAISCALALAATALYAGGPAVVQDEEVVVAEKPASSTGPLIPLLLLALIGLAIASGDDDTPQGCLPL